MVQIFSNKLICIVLVVIIIINTFLPSVCYGNDEFLDTYYITDDMYQEKMEINEDNVENIAFSMINIQPSSITVNPKITIGQKLASLIDGDIDSQTTKDIINNGKNLLYNIGGLLDELEDCNFDISLLSEENKSLYYNLVSDTRYYWIMLYHFGDYGAWTYYELVTLMAEQDPNYEWLLENDDWMSQEGMNPFNSDRLSFLGQMNDSFNEVYKEYIDDYYYTPGGNQTTQGGSSAVVPDEDVEDVTHDEVKDNVNDDVENEIDGNKSGGVILGFLDYATGLLLYIPKLMLMSIPLLAQSILSLIVSGGQSEWAWVGVEQILFNKITITNINFFSQTTVGGEEINSDLINSIRGYVTNWYYAFRNLVIVLYLCILIYIGIRMAISSIPEDRAKYKAMLTNWFVGLGLVFVLQYIMIIVIQANELLISTIEPKEVNGNLIQQFLKTLYGQIFWLSFTTSMGSLIMYWIFVILTFIFFIIYLKRMLTISFLIIIAPLITLTYPIDKAADNKSQILNSWMGEFISDVLIQFFHCVAYVVLVQSSMETLAEANGSFNFGAMTVAIVCTCCIFYAEKILKQLFGLNRGGSTFLQNVAMGAVLNKVIDNVKVIKGSKNDKPNDGVLDIMPDGQDTSQAAIKLNNPQINTKLEQQLGKPVEESSKSNGQPSQNKKQDKDKKDPNIFQKGAKAYFGGLDALGKAVVLGYGAISKAHKNRFSMKTKEVQKLFNIALERYSSTGEEMTKEQFLLKMQALKNTDIGNIRNASDANMKEWMMALEASYANSGRINPVKFLDKSIEIFADKHKWKE